MEIIESEKIMKKAISKSPIDQIKFLPYASNLLLVLTDWQMYLVDAKSGLKHDLVNSSKYRLFSLNEFSKGYQYEVAVVTRKYEIDILSFNPSQ
jgi:hypothetical protein